MQKVNREILFTAFSINVITGDGGYFTGGRLNAKKRRWFISRHVAQLWMTLQQEEAVDAKK